MSIYSDWRNDKLARRISGWTLVATLAVPFLGRAAVELSWWTNLLIGVTILVVGGIGALWQLRRTGSRGNVPNERGEGEPSTEDEHTAQPEPTAIEEKTVGRWELVMDSIRKAPIVAGEGPVLLMGYAQVDAVGDDENKKLYFCKMYDARQARPYFEFRVNAPRARLLKRHSEMRLLPGEIVVSERTWTLEGSEEPNNNIVGDWKSIAGESRELIEGSERMVVVWSDTISYGADTAETKTHRLVVPLDGFLVAEQDIGYLRNRAATRHSPF